MIPLTICVGMLALLFWAATKYERKIEVLSKWYSRHDNVKIGGAELDAILEACDLIMEIHSDPQSDEYRAAMELKLYATRRRIE